MRALVIHAEKDLRIEERQLHAPGKGEVRIAIRAGGICGSDLHYYSHGGFGAVRLREPMILGHEVAGEIIAVGDNATGLKTGDRVAVSPSRPCNACPQCLHGRQNHCLNMRFYGSAMPMPHIQGAFAEEIIAHDWQCHKIDDGISMNQAAFAEPLSVVLHGAQRAGNLFGAKVLVTGCGPIGALCILAARRAGASHIVATDISDAALTRAQAIGADEVINVLSAPEKLAAYGANKGTFDVMFEASGSPAAIEPGLTVLRPQGVLVQLGLGGETRFPVNLLVSKEIEMRGSFRFHEEFGQAVHLINRREVDVMALLSHRFAFDDAKAAFEQACDKSAAMKVQIDF